MAEQVKLVDDVKNDSTFEDIIAHETDKLVSIHIISYQ